MPTRDNIGPVYCERLMNAGVSEPINFITNIVAATLAVYLIYRFSNRKEFFPFGIFAGVLLFMTGVGSFLWHGYRTPLYLALDTIPGVLLLLSCIFYLYGKTFSFKVSGAMIISFFSLTSVASFTFIRTTPILFFLFLFGSVLAVSLFLIYTNYKKNISVKYLIIGVLLALFAAIFRTIDLFVCEIFPTGTHFLWHILLPTGAYFTILHSHVLFKTLNKT